MKTQYSSERYYFLDWLRILVVLDLIPFHVAWVQTFVPGFSQIQQDSVIAQMLKYYVCIINRWHMPLLFFVSGIAAFISLSHRSWFVFLGERSRRLLAPLIVFMLAIFQPLAYYTPWHAGVKSLPDYIFHFWPNTLKHFYNGGYNGGPIWGHMWFVGYLLIYTFLCLPIFLYLSKDHGHRLSGWLSFTGNRIWTLLLPTIPLVIINVTMTLKWPCYQNNLYTDWSNFSYNLVVFLYGYILASNKSFWAAVDIVYAYILPIAVALGLIEVYLTFGVHGFATAVWTPKHWFYSIITGANPWLWLIGMLGVGRKWLHSRNRLLDYFNEAFYPIYILHLTVIFVIGFYVVQWRLNVLSEFIVIFCLSFLVILAMYDLLIRRWKVLRLMFGMKAQKAGR